MPPIIPISSNRVSGQLIEQRLLSQLRSDNLALLRIQDQLSSGRRIASPSDDARVSLRAIRIQRLLEQKEQLQLNVSTSGAYLGASDTALTGVANLLINVRGLAITAADTTTSDIERRATSVEILRAVQRVADLGNQKFRGRYLFAGAQTDIQPFDVIGNQVVYHGDDGKLLSLADVDLLARSNVSGHEAFGAISAGVQGTVDLNPVTTEETRLSDLRGGLGINHLTLNVSDGVTNKKIDLSSAETLGDVVRLIEANPPDNRTISVRVAQNGLVLDLDKEGGGNLLVFDVAGGSSATQLGIKTEIGNGTRILGEDLNPQLRLTTELRDLLGSRATAVLQITGDNNDVFLEAKERGSDLNTVTVQFVDDDLLQAAPGLLAGGEVAELSATVRTPQASLALSGSNDDLTLIANVAGASFNNISIEIDASQSLGNAAVATFDPTASTLTLQIDSNSNTTLSTLIGAINSQGAFTAIPDNSKGEGFSPSDTINATDGGTVSGNTGNSGGPANTIYVRIEPGKTRANDIVKALQVSAEISDLFDVRIDGKDTVLNVDEGNGLVDVNSSAVTTGGSGKEFDQAPGIRIINGDFEHIVSFQGAETVEDLLNRLNGSDASVIARINAAGNGIDVQSRLSGSDFHIGENGGATATELGLRTFTGDLLLKNLNHGAGVASGIDTDFTIIRNDGVELDIDISFASTVTDIIDIINNHADNLDADGVTARLAEFGNGIELVDDNPDGGQTLTIRKSVLSTAAWDLGLIPEGQIESYPASIPPVAATANVLFAAPNNVDTSIIITAAVPGSELNGVRIEFINDQASGNQAFLNYDSDAKRLRIDVDPTATTVSTVIAAIEADGTFTAELDPSDPGNNGSGLVVETGTLATTSGGVPTPTATASTALIEFDPPLDINTAFRVTATELGTKEDDIEIVLTSGTVSGNVALVVYDDTARQLRIDIDPTQTTAGTVVNAITAEGTFTAALDLETDLTNDGSGIIGVLGTVGTTGGGSAEILTGRDVAPLETAGIFNSLLRLHRGIDDFDIVEIERAIVLLDQAVDQLNFSRADLGAREQGLDSINRRLQDEDVDLRAALSVDIDTDFVQAISELTSRQAALEASLRLIGRTLRLTLLEFL